MSMKVEIRRIGWPEIYERLKKAPAGKLWGIPRGGQIVAGLTGRAVDAIEEADAIVDDVLHTGMTMQKAAQHFIDAGRGRKGFHVWALVNRLEEKIPENVWIVFPWENEGDLFVRQGTFKK